MNKIISKRAIFDRINRRLAKEGRQLYKTSRYTVNRDELGAYHVVDMEKGIVVEHGIESLGSIGKRVGALKVGEQVDE